MIFIGFSFHNLKCNESWNHLPLHSLTLSNKIYCHYGAVTNTFIKRPRQKLLYTNTQVKSWDLHSELLSLLYKNTLLFLRIILLLWSLMFFVFVFFTTLFMSYNMQCPIQSEQDFINIPSLCFTCLLLVLIIKVLSIE